MENRSTMPAFDAACCSNTAGWMQGDMHEVHEVHEQMHADMDEVHEQIHG